MFQIRETSSAKLANGVSIQKRSLTKKYLCWFLEASLDCSNGEKNWRMHTWKSTSWSSRASGDRDLIVTSAAFHPVVRILMFHVRIRIVLRYEILESKEDLKVERRVRESAARSKKDRPKRSLANITNNPPKLNQPLKKSQVSTPSRRFLQRPLQRSNHTVQCQHSTLNLSPAFTSQRFESENVLPPLTCAIFVVSFLTVWRSWALSLKLLIASSSSSNKCAVNTSQFTARPQFIGQHHRSSVQQRSEPSCQRAFERRQMKEQRMVRSIRRFEGHR